MERLNPQPRNLPRGWRLITGILPDGRAGVFIRVGKTWYRRERFDRESAKCRRSGA